MRFFGPFHLVQEGDLGSDFIFGFGGVENSPRQIELSILT